MSKQRRHGDRTLLTWLIIVGVVLAADDAVAGLYLLYCLIMWLFS